MLSQKICSLILAGKRKADPLSAHFNIPNKAFIELKQKPLIFYVLEALEGANLNNILISAQEEQKDIFQKILQNRDIKLFLVSAKDSPVDVVFKALNLPMAQNGLLITTADNALLSPKIINYFLKVCQNSEAELLIGVVNGQDSLIQKFPQAKRTWHKLNKKTWLSGANLFFWKSRLMTDHPQEILRRLEEQRKSPLEFAKTIAKSFNWWFFLKLLFQRASLKECNKALSEALNLNTELIIVPFEEACIDIDNLEDLKLAEEIL